MKFLVSTIFFLLVSMQGLAGVHASPWVKQRLEWNDFIKTDQYKDYLYATRIMEENKNPSDPNSLLFWRDVHKESCDHTIDTGFLSWHRGFVFLYEKQIQKISKNKKFRLPYWNYYAHHEVPKAFTENPESNPLYRVRNTNNVEEAFSGEHNMAYSVFAADVFGGSRGFENTLSYAPHSFIHNLLGNGKLGMAEQDEAAGDPIFFIHHATIDQLWSAWVAAGHELPTLFDPYWKGMAIYSSGNPGAPVYKILKKRLMVTNKSLRYQYADLSIPQNDEQSYAALNKPPKVEVSNLKTKSVTPSVDMLGSTTGITLANESVTVSIPVTDKGSAAVFKSMVSDRLPAEKMTAKLLLRGVQYVGPDSQQGNSYIVYINLPDVMGKDDHPEDHVIGHLTPFGVSGVVYHNKAHAKHTGWSEEQGVNISLSLTGINPDILNFNHSEVDISFFRAGFKNDMKRSGIKIQSIELMLETKE